MAFFHLSWVNSLHIKKERSRVHDADVAARRCLQRQHMPQMNLHVQNQKVLFFLVYIMWLFVKISSQLEWLSCLHITHLS